MFRSLLLFGIGLVITNCASKPAESTSPSTPEAEANALPKIDRHKTLGEIRSHVPEIMSCYEGALAKDPRLEGRVVVRFEINDQGKISKFENLRERSTLNEPKVIDCLSEAMKTWTFPKPPPGITAEITFPFTFSHKK